MSQRECAGFNWPPLTVPAEDPVSISPVTVSRAGPIKATMRGRSLGFDPSPELFRWSRTTGVGQPASTAASIIVVPVCAPRARLASGVSALPCCATVGVGHPVQPLADVRRADARSAQIGGPDRISQCFQVSSYSNEPFTSILARNLLSKADWRPALGDEVSKSGPKVSLVGFPFPLAGDGERLART